MLLDNENLWADSLAYDGSPTEINFGTASPGAGKPIKCFITVEATLTGATGFQILDAPHATADENVMSIDAVPAAGETIEFQLPSDIQQYVNIALIGTASAGTFSAGVVMDVQTNK